MLSLKLKEETQQPHQELERLLISKLKAIQASGDYCEVLQWFYGFYSVLEQQLHQAPGAERIPQFSKRQKTPALASDLAAFNTKPFLQAHSDELPPVVTEEDALGIAYVMEGSTLGGQIITKMVAKKLDRSTTEGLAFFSGY